MTPAASRNTTLYPVCLWLLNQPLAIRRAVTAGEHVMLLPQLSVGKSKSPRHIRDHRAAVQECFKVYTDQCNEVFSRGFKVHGSHILNCPFDEEILFVPFRVASTDDAVRVCAMRLSSVVT
jgi:hypothetical protein